MPEREVITDTDACGLARRWGIDDDLARRLVLSAQDFTAETGRSVWMVSGFRTRAEQELLDREGRPAAPFDLSTHTTCPATGADVSLGFGVNRVLKAIWGRIVFMNGLRWGGGSAEDDLGIPDDYQHVDLGPRGTRQAA